MIKLPGNHHRYFIPKSLSEIDEERNELVTKYFPGFRVISSIRKKEGIEKQSISVDEFLSIVQKYSYEKELDQNTEDICSEDVTNCIDQGTVTL